MACTLLTSRTASTASAPYGDYCPALERMHAVESDLPGRIERTWLGLVAVQSTAGRAGKLDVVAVHLAIAQDGYMSDKQRDVEGGPFSEAMF